MALYRARAASSTLFRSLLHAPSRSLSSGNPDVSLYICDHRPSGYEFAVSMMLQYAGGIETVEPKSVPSWKSMISQMFTLDINSQIGSCMPLSNMRIGMQIHNIEIRPGQGGKLVRAAGTSAKILTEPNRSTRY
ncbi:UNVERIFIED_CONTAM: 50S ribosomal protein L2 [Sesamum latifolium]|uniref:50S ribosomal protein L2 n=1 Tax=Sesamum latifolium TaxID=2727402 RepID=A0AAW2XLU8_9LAMI